MSNTMKKTCRGCRALEWNYPDYLCKLEYKMKTIRQLDGSFEIMPLDPCPKPLTFDAYFTIVQDRENKIRVAKFNKGLEEIKAYPGVKIKKGDLEYYNNK